jgi:membrane fusion protein, heavy metal efflux system
MPASFPHMEKSVEAMHETTAAKASGIASRLSGRKWRAWRTAALALLAGVPLLAGSWYFGASVVPSAHSSVPAADKDLSRRGGGSFMPTASQWGALTVETVAPQTFRTIVTTDGRIAIDEDHTTPVFSPYAGRVMALHAKAGDKIEAGQPLFTIAASEMVQAQNDVVGAVAALNKANSAFRLAEINLTRARNLFEAKAGSQRDFQAAEDTRNATQADKAASEAALEAARNRLRLFGKSDQEIAVFQKEGRISPETVIKSPLSGTVVQRKVGPGQFVAGAQSEPVFVIGDLSTVWVVANVKETDAPVIRVGAPFEFRVLALPNQTFSATLNYISSSVDPATRRLAVRAEVPNPGGMLKPEMFAMVDVVTASAQSAPSIPRGALIYEGETAYVWSVSADKSVSKRAVKAGTASEGRVQVLAGIGNGDRIVTKGSLFIDRLAGTSE